MLKSPRKSVVALLAAVLLLWAGAAWASPYGQDAPFNTNVGNQVASSAYWTEVQPDGKILVGGDFADGLRRFNSDGTADSAFNAAVAGQLGGEVYTIALQPDGMILVGGSFPGHLARFSSDGTRDTAFDAALGSVLNSDVWEVAVQSDGKIVIGGYFDSGVDLSGSLARLNPDGTLDAAFNNKVMEDELDDAVYALGIQPDGKILIGGGFEGSPSDFLGRINPDGSRDTAFGDNVADSIEYDVYDLALQPDGKILVGGDFRSDPADFLGRYNADGTPDTAFNTRMGDQVQRTVYSIAMQPDGTIIVGGCCDIYTGDAGSPLIGLVAFKPDGTPFDAFNNAMRGQLSGSSVLSVALQPDGKVLAGGSFTTSESSNFARFGFPVPQIGLTPKSEDFGKQTLGQSGKRTITVTNTGDAALKVASVAIEGADAGQFAIESETCTSGEIAPGATCTVTVRFAPTAAGAKSAKLVVKDAVWSQVGQAELSGTGEAAPTPPPTPTGKKAQKPNSRSMLPAKIKNQGLTVIAPANPRTTAGQRLTTRVRCEKPLVAGELRYCSVRSYGNGKVTVRTFGNDVSRIVVTQTAPGTAKYKPYRAKTVYRNGAKR